MNKIKTDFLTHSTGAALIYEKKIFRIGITPEVEDLSKLVEWAADNVNEPLYTCTNLSGVYPAADKYQKIAAGLLMLEVTKELNEYIFWFKPEHVQTIKWAGDPNKPVEFNEHGLSVISPRHSFQIWSQLIKANSENWWAEEMQSAVRLKEEIIHAINLKAGALRLLNEKLRVAYEELDSFSYTISHDLKSPIAIIKGYAQLLNASET